jgi:predicted nucleotidyltransferase
MTRVQLKRLWIARRQWSRPFKRRELGMLEVLQKRKGQRAKSLDMARAYADGLRESLGKVTAIVYGSVARGDFNLGSDVDVLIIAEVLPAHPLARMELLYSCLERPLEPKAYTLAEFQTLRDRGHPFIFTVLTEGIAVTDDLSLATVDNSTMTGGKETHG